MRAEQRIGQLLLGGSRCIAAVTSRMAWLASQPASQQPVSQQPHHHHIVLLHLALLLQAGVAGQVATRRLAGGLCAGLVGCARVQRELAAAEGGREGGQDEGGCGEEQQGGGAQSYVVAKACGDVSTHLLPRQQVAAAAAMKRQSGLWL